MTPKSKNTTASKDLADSQAADAASAAASSSDSSAGEGSTLEAQAARTDAAAPAGDVPVPPGPDVDPGVGVAPQPVVDNGDKVTVRLAQHWTDDDGNNHLPKSYVQVSPDVAASWRASGMAMKADSWDPTEPAGGEYQRFAEIASTPAPDTGVDTGDYVPFDEAAPATAEGSTEK